MYVRIRQDTLRALHTIEARSYSTPLDYTRAAILRASLRSYEIDAEREAREALRIEGIRLPETTLEALGEIRQC
jgi:hypothetical protein